MIVIKQEPPQWMVQHFVIEMYKSPPSIVLLPFSIHSWVNLLTSLITNKKYMFFCVK